MSKIIDFRPKNKAVSYSALNSNEIKKRTKELMEKREKEEPELDRIAIKKLKKELDEIIKNGVENAPMAKMISVKLVPSIAIRVYYRKLYKILYKEYKERGLYFYFEYIKLDAWNVVGRADLLWDLDYSNFYNRVFRKLLYNPIKTIFGTLLLVIGSLYLYGVLS